MFSDFTSDLIESHFCITADYGVFPNFTISVENRDRKQSVAGPESLILGWAAQDDPSKEAGELTVHLQGVPVAAPYTIVALGPENDYNGGLYDWAVVTDPFQLGLFVLARNVTQFYAIYNASVYTMLLNMGFDTGLNNPVPVQQLGCTYWPS